MVNSKLNRVVITGLGAVTPLGNTVTQYWQGLLQGCSGIAPITLFDASHCACQIAGEVRAFDPRNYLKHEDIEHTDRFVQFAICASQQAIADARIEINDLNNTTIGVLIGTGFGGIQVLEDQEKVYLTCGPNHCNPFMMVRAFANMAAGITAIYTGAKGPTSCIVTACASGSHAIGEAFRLIQWGYAKAMICGGTEAPITPLSIAGFASAKALSTGNHEPTQASRPFDRARDGFVMGEGSGLLLLEDLEHAQRRGAHIYAEIVGYGQSCDAYHITAPVRGGEGAAKAMQLSLQDAGLSSHQVDYINAHGTSTIANDVTETLAIKKALGQYAYQVAISSTKSMTGHLLGGAGGIEAIATVMAIATDNIPPTINLNSPDPDCDLDYVPNCRRNQLVKVALSNSFGFGGHNVTLAFQKFSD